MISTPAAGPLAVAETDRIAVLLAEITGATATPVQRKSKAPPVEPAPAPIARDSVRQMLERANWRNESPEQIESPRTERPTVTEPGPLPAPFGVLTVGTLFGMVNWRNRSDEVQPLPMIKPPPAPGRRVHSRGGDDDVRVGMTSLGSRLRLSGVHQWCSMIAPLSAILRQSDGRYLSAEERDAVLAFALGLPAAVQAGQEVEAQESAVIAAVVGELRDQFPRFDRLFADAWEQFAADLRLVLRADVRAMLSGDLRVLEDKALFYLRSILTAYNVTPHFAREAFARLRDRCRERLRTDTFARLAPFLERNIQVLADFPEPAVAMV